MVIDFNTTLPVGEIVRCNVQLLYNPRVNRICTAEL
jgi:hypothetical protein